MDKLRSKVLRVYPEQKYTSLENEQIQMMELLQKQDKLLNSIWLEAVNEFQSDNPDSKIIINTKHKIEQLESNIRTVEIKFLNQFKLRLKKSTINFKLQKTGKTILLKKTKNGLELNNPKDFPDQTFLIQKYVNYLKSKLVYFKAFIENHLYNISNDTSEELLPYQIFKSHYLPISEILNSIDVNDLKLQKLIDVLEFTNIKGDINRILAIAFYYEGDYKSSVAHFQESNSLNIYNEGVIHLKAKVLLYLQQIKEIGSAETELANSLLTYKKLLHHCESRMEVIDEESEKYFELSGKIIGALILTGDPDILDLVKKHINKVVSFDKSRCYDKPENQPNLFLIKLAKSIWSANFEYFNFLNKEEFALITLNFLEQLNLEYTFLDDLSAPTYSNIIRPKNMNFDEEHLVEDLKLDSNHIENSTAEADSTAEKTYLYFQKNPTKEFLYFFKALNYYFRYINANVKVKKDLIFAWINIRECLLGMELKNQNQLIQLKAEVLRKEILSNLNDFNDENEQKVLT